MEWIKCSERLPEEEQEVLVYWKNQQCKTSGYFLDKITFPKDDNLWAYVSKEDVLAWMSLPDAPKE